MITTNDSEVYEKIWSLKDHGKNRTLASTPKKSAGFQWLHDDFGGNGRMMEFQAAIGRLQLQRLPEWTSARQNNARLIQETCRRHSVVRVPIFRCNRQTCAVDCPPSSGCQHAYYKCYVYLEPSKLAEGWDRDRVIAEINVKGVPCYHGACPEIYLEKAFDNTGWRPAERLPVAKELGETSLMFLVHPTLTDEEVTKTCETLDAVLREASGN